MPGCNKRYTDPSSLRKHVRTHGHYYRGEVLQPAKIPLSSLATSIPPPLPAGIISLRSNGVILHQPQSSQFLPKHSSLTPGIQTVAQSNTLLSTGIFNGTISMVTSHVADLLPRTATPLSIPILKVEQAASVGAPKESEKSQDAPLDLSRSPQADSPESDRHGLSLHDVPIGCGKSLKHKLYDESSKNGLLDLSHHFLGQSSKSAFPAMNWSSFVLNTPPSSRSVTLDFPCCLVPQ